MNVHIVVIGDAILDRDLAGGVSRVAPDAPVPVVDLTAAHERPGGAALAAAMLARGCACVTLATCLGRDVTGRRVRDLLAGPGGQGTVDILELAPVAATRGITRIRSGEQALLRMDESGTALPADAGVDADALEAAVERADAVLVADYGAGVSAHPAVRDVLARWAGRRPVVWDPHPRGHEPVPGVTIATPNRSEVAGVMQRHGLVAASAGLDGDAEAVRAHWQARSVAATDGATGAFTAVVGSAPLFTPAPTRVPGDTCGAGDRFAGAVARTLGQHFRATADRSGPYRATAQDVAAAVGAAVTDVAGWLAAGGVSRESTRSSLGARPPGEPAPAAAPPSGVALEPVSAVRAGGGTIVATGGCFDVLHAGHVASLEAARALGDCLVVLLNSDASVRRLKGPGRPVHTAADRQRVLESLQCVDAVVVFEDDDPRRALEALRPDVWAKGGDYADADLPEAALIRQWGGRVVLLPYLPDRSTTRILAHTTSQRALVRAGSRPESVVDQEVAP